MVGILVFCVVFYTSVKFGICRVESQNDGLEAGVVQSLAWTPVGPVATSNDDTEEPTADDFLDEMESNHSVACQDDNAPDAVPE